MTTSCLPDRGRGAAAGLMFAGEACWGSPDLIGHRARGLEIVSEGLVNRIDRLDSQLIRSDRMKSKPVQGNRSPGGPINGELQIKTWPTLLVHSLCLESEVVTRGSGPYTHRFNGGLYLPEGLTFEKGFDFRTANTKRLQFRGSRINEVAIVQNQGAIATVQAQILAREMVDDVADTGESLEALHAATYAANNPSFTSFQCSLRVGSAVLATAKSAEVTWNNGMDPNDFVLDGTALRADLAEDQRTIGGKTQMFFTPGNYDRFYRAYENGDSLAVHYVWIRGHNRLEIFLPSVTFFGEPTPVINGRGPINMNFEFDAERDEESNTDIQVTVVNDEPVLSTAV